VAAQNIYTKLVSFVFFHIYYHYFSPIVHLFLEEQKEILFLKEGDKSDFVCGRIIKDDVSW
jgi:hypothetical protein